MTRRRTTIFCQVNDSFICAGDAASCCNLVLTERSPVPGAPDNPAARIKNGRIAITPAEMKEIFDAVIDPVVTLVKGQINSVVGSSYERTVSAIVLVGGFSECSYLVKRLMREVGTDKMPILKSPNA